MRGLTGKTYSAEPHARIGMRGCVSTRYHVGFVRWSREVVSLHTTVVDYILL